VQPTAGPHRPLLVTSDRRAHSARRTTSIDVRWPDFRSGRVEVVVRGQDLWTGAAGQSSVTGSLDLHLVAELASGRIVQVEGPSPSMVERLLGASLRSGFRRHLAEADPEGGEQRTLSYSALDDLPGAFLVSGYSMLRAGLLDGDPEAARARAPRQGDICVGWRTDGPVYVELARQGRNAVPYGPAAPEVERAEPGGWHPLDPMAHGTVRRRRQLDVWAADHGGGLEVQAHFRDSYVGDEPEMVMHEYLVEATFDRGHTVSSLHVDPLVLPWESCPGAVASADALVGIPLPKVEAVARAETSGVAGCTHLTSTLRSLADVQALKVLL
jgi:hypothetical protein